MTSDLRQPVDPVAFVCALIGAPIVVAILGFWAYFIPVAALVVGGLPYVIVGAPILLWLLPRYGPNVLIIAASAFASVAIPVLVMYSVFLMTPDKVGFLEPYIAIGVFGLFFAPVWGAMFAWLYKGFKRTPVT